MPSNASAQLREIAVRLKEVGDGRVIKRDMARAIRTGAAPLIPAVRAAAEAQLPKRGGLNRYEANQKIRVAVLTGARTAGVRIVGKASTATDTGTWRHPTPELMGYDRSYWKWKEQTYPAAAGWWSKTLERDSRVVTPAVVAAMQRAASYVQGV